MSGGIAAYKACELLRLLTESGHDVTVVPTAVGAEVRRRRHLGGAVRPAGRHRVCERRRRGAARPARPGGRPGRRRPGHRRPAGRAAHGRADDLLTTTLLTARCPVVLAPAMHTEMWEHPATQANVATLRERGVARPRPGVGRLTGADTGPGRLPEPAEIFEVAVDVLAPRAGRPSADLAGRRVVVSRRRHPRAPRPGALPRQPLLRQAGLRPRPRGGGPRRRGHAGRRQRRLPDPAGVHGASGSVSARELRDAVLEPQPSADAVVMAAAPADFRPADRSDHKIKKRPDGRGPDDRARREPRHPGRAGRADGRRAPRRSWSGSRPRPATPRQSCSTTPAPSWPARAATCSSSTTSAAGAVFGSRRQPGRDPRRRRDRDQAVPRGSKRTLAHVIWDRRRHLGRRRVCEPSGINRAGRPRPAETLSAVAQARCGRSHVEERCVVTSPVHLRVRHRGSPGQDRRPDQRLHPRRPARGRTPRAGSRSRP